MADGVWTDGQRDGLALTLIINQLFFCNVPTFEYTILITTSWSLNFSPAVVSLV